MAQGHGERFICVCGAHGVHVTAGHVTVRWFVSQSAQQRQHKAEEASARASARLARRQAETEAAARAAEEQVGVLRLDATKTNSAEVKDMWMRDLGCFVTQLQERGSRTS